jgi:hypothetical protein
MNQASEAAAIAEVEERLADRFPEVSPEVVEAAVRAAHAEVQGPIRDFVPLLVEHAARDHLARITADT